MTISNTVSQCDINNRQDMDGALNAISLLRDQGYAVVVFTSEELDGANPRKVSERLVELGWDVIDNLK